MRINIFAASTTFSGGRLALFRHANELVRRDHDVSVWVQGSQTKIDWMDTDFRLDAFSISSLRQFAPADICIFDRIRLAQPLYRARIGTVVHFCQGFEGTDAQLRIQSVWHQGGGIRRWPELWKLWRRRRAIDQAYHLPTTKVVTHRHLASLIGSRFHQPSHFVPYGLPAGVFTPGPPRPAKGRSVLIVGPSDIGWKRIIDALAAVRLLKQRMEDVHVIRVSQHPMRPIEEAFGITDEYSTMLRPLQMAQLYRRADVMLLSSDATEGFGLPLLEAMSCGLPTVVTNIPAFRTFAQPDDYARFVEVGDTHAMAATLEQILHSPTERQRLSQRGQEVAAQYTMQRSADAMEATLTAIAAGRPAALAA
jgi:glycosyltransferase involved in cell wall biosynthesis